jgi:hypothetical protein
MENSFGNKRKYKMKNLILFTALLCFTSVIGQIELESNQKNSCTILADGQTECVRNPIKTFFYIDYGRNTILQKEDAQKTAFIIDSKTISNRETIIWNVHTATGERLTITVSDRSVRIQSLAYKDSYTEFDL